MKTDDDFCKQYCTPKLGWTKSGRALCRKESRCEEYTRHAESIVKTHEAVHHPKHYTKHPSGIECIQVTRCLTFDLGNAVKYIWRAGQKDNIVQDLEKSLWYINDMRTYIKSNFIHNPHIALEKYPLFSHALLLLPFTKEAISKHMPEKLNSVFEFIWEAELCSNDIQGYSMALMKLDIATEYLQGYIHNVKAAS